MNELLEKIQYFDFPFEVQQASGLSLLLVTFLAGLFGSLHCLGMCGGLVLAVAHSWRENILYQIGRLIGYLGVGLLAGMLGKGLIENISQKISSYAFLILGMTLILLGLRPFIKLKLSLKFDFLKKINVSVFFHRLGQKIYRSKLKGSQKSFMVGLFSVFLPCGLLYGVVFVVMSFHRPMMGALALFSFWLGTLPAMLLAIRPLKKLLFPLVSRSPQIMGLLFILLGVMTLAFRYYSFFSSGGKSCCH